MDALARDQVRQLTGNAADTREMDLDDLDPNSIDKKLLDIGVILPTTRTSLAVLSYVFASMFSATIGSQRESSCPFDPIKLLKYGLLHVSPTTI